MREREIVFVQAIKREYVCVIINQIFSTQLFACVCVMEAIPEVPTIRQGPRCMSLCTRDQAWVCVCVCHLHSAVDSYFCVYV